MCDSAMVLSDGKIVAKGTPQQLVKIQDVEKYLAEGLKFRKKWKIRSK